MADKKGINEMSSLDNFRNLKTALNYFLQDVKEISPDTEQLDPYIEWKKRSDAFDNKLIKADYRKRCQYTGIYPLEPSYAQKLNRNTLRRSPRIGKHKPSQPSTKVRNHSLSRIQVATQSLNWLVPGNRGRKNKIKTAAKKRHHSYLSDICPDSKLIKFAKETVLTIDELESLRLKFMTEAISSTLTQQQFFSFLVKIYPQLESRYSLVYRLFCYFNKSNTGFVNFEEFVYGISKTIKCTNNEKLELIFACVDFDGNKKIGHNELVHWINMGYNYDISNLESTEAFVAETFSLDEGGDFSLEEFKQSLKNNHILIHLLSKSIPFPCMKKSTAQFANLSCKWTFEHVKELWREFYCGKAGKRDNGMIPHQISKADFKKMFGKYMGFDTESQETHLNRLFSIIDKDDSGGISFKEILHGLTLLFVPSKQELCSFYFSLYDKDDDGRIRISDFRDLLEHSYNQAKVDIDIQVLLDKHVPFQTTIDYDTFSSLVEELPDVLIKYHSNLFYRIE